MSVLLYPLFSFPRSVKRNVSKIERIIDRPVLIQHETILSII